MGPASNHTMCLPGNRAELVMQFPSVYLSARGEKETKRTCVLGKKDELSIRSNTLHLFTGWLLS